MFSAGLMRSAVTRAAIANAIARTTPIPKSMARILALVAVFAMALSGVNAFATNYTVKSGGGGNYTTIQACATAMAPGDTCTVFAGTYNENVTVTAGTTGNYKTITVNGSDTVSVLSFTLNSHTQLDGNCPTLQGTVTTASCGFFISNPSNPTAAPCVSVASSATDIYIRNNTLYACGTGQGAGMIQGSGATFIYIQGNTLSYSGATVATATTVKEGNGIELGGSSSHILEEDNDLSHYTLGFCCGDQTYFVIRNNNPHDQYETEASGNAHTDAFYFSPNVTTAEILVEGNDQYNGVGANAKGILNQGQFSPCNGLCGNVMIYRYNLVSSIGSGNTSTYGWSNFVVYNNTYYNIGNLCSSCYGGGDNFFSDTCGSGGSCPTKQWADINNIWYFPTAQPISGIANPTAADSNSTSGGALPVAYGHNLAYCNANGSSNCSLFGYKYQVGTWTGDPGNILGYANQTPNTNDPKFVNTGSDFHLQSGSPAIAAGTSLTTANGGGSTSTALVVNNPAYFQDGYGLSNAYSTVHPDCIAITTVTNVVCVTAVNYATSTLTLASAKSWSNGDPVWLYSKSDGTRVLTGAAPDLGAYPYSSGSTYTITVSSITGNGTVTSSDSVLNCTTGTTGTCTDSTATGTVTLTAAPSSGYSFTSWGGGTCSGSSTVCTVSGAATVTATFTANPFAPGAAPSIFASLAH